MNSGPATTEPTLRLEWRSPSELAENPSNWRRHPEGQQTALADCIGQVGWAGACLYNERTGRLVDGHARRKYGLEHGDEPIPVLVGSWSEEDERLILATLDPLAAMAQADAGKLDELLRGVETSSQAVAEMLADLAGGMPVEFSGPPESVRENIEELEKIKHQRREGNANAESKNDTERYLVIVYPSRAAKEADLHRLGLPADERYVPAGSLKIDSRAIVRRTPVKPNGRAAKSAPAKKSGAGG